MSSMKTVADNKQAEGDAMTDTTTAAPIPGASTFAHPSTAASSFFNFATFPRKSDQGSKSRAKKSKQKISSSRSIEPRVLIPLPPPPSLKTLGDARSGNRKKGTADKTKRMESFSRESGPLSAETELSKVVTTEGGAEAVKDSSLQHSIADVRQNLEKVGIEIDVALVDGLPEDHLLILRDFVRDMEAYFSNCQGRVSDSLNPQPKM